VYTVSYYVPFYYLVVDMRVRVPLVNIY